MISKEDFEKRAKTLYAHQQSMVREKRWKTGKRAGTVRRPKQELPFTALDLARFLWRWCGLNARPCPYCGRPVDILSLTLDHKMPRSRGGALGIENLEPCCTDCNSLKGAMDVEEFAELRAWLVTVSPFLREHITTRLRQSANAHSAYRGPRAPAPPGPPEIRTSRPLPKYREPQRNLNLLPEDF